MIRAHAGDPVPADPGDAAVLVLGGGYLPTDDARAPWLPATRALVAAALRRGAPVFGVCLGGQLLAEVAGGTVAARHGRPELGSTPLAVRPEAAGDALFHGLPPTVSAIERHEDAITALPPGATWLVSSADCPYQAFRVGERAWGVQFHPEVPAGRLRGWEPERLRARGLDPAEVRRAAAAAEPAAAPVWWTVTRRLAGVIRAA